MPEIREPVFKLFGKTIQIPVRRTISFAHEEDSYGDVGKPPTKKTTCYPEKGEDESNIPTAEEKIDVKASPVEKLKAGDGANQPSNNLEDKSPRKPNKIIPCPRCKSMDTKFCYFNNYNVNQPRHFCKKCQRYWTAGGSMRNVPVGAGRRKSKVAGSIQHYRNVAIPHIGETDPESIHHLPPLKPTGTVLSFGSDIPLREPRTSVLNPFEQTVKNRDLLRGSQISNHEEKESTNSNGYGFPPAQYLNGAPWSYPWNPPPPFCVPSFSFPFYPLNAYWSMPWPLPQVSNSMSSASSSSLLNSPILSKRSRDGDLLNHDNSEKEGSSTPDNCIWIPKTMRIDDTEKAAMLPFWATTEFINDKSEAISRGEGLFKAFQSGSGQKLQSAEVSPFLFANPAAVSRSFTFQES